MFPVSIPGWGDGDEFTYVIDGIGGASEQQPNDRNTPPKAPIRLRHKGISPRPQKSKPRKNSLPSTKIRKIDFDRDTSILKKQKTTNCCLH